MTKKKETPVLYNADQPQIIPLDIRKNNKTFRVRHELKPLSDERFFQCEREKIEAAKRIVKNETLTTSAYVPVENLWNDLIVKREGYKNESGDLTKSTYLMDKVQAVTALLEARAIEDEPDILEAELLDDFYEVGLRALQSGILIETAHVFREESREQMDEYISIVANKPSPIALASAARPETLAERMCILYDETCTGATGYAEGARVPAWHKIVATTAHYSRQFARLGKQ